MATLSAAMTRVDECAGIDKARACIAELSRSERFMLNKCPPELPNDNAEACIFLGFPSTLPIAQVTRLRTAWGAHRSNWIAQWGKPRTDGKKASDLTLRDASLYWKSLLEDNHMKDLAATARDELLRPFSSAVCERVFSYLTQLDSAQRRRMKPALLRDLLFIRANWHIVEELLREEADASRAARELSKAKAVAGGVLEREKDGKKAVAKAAAATAAACKPSAVDSAEDTSLTPTTAPFPPPPRHIIFPFVGEWVALTA